MLWDLIQQCSLWGLSEKIEGASQRMNIQTNRISFVNDRVDDLEKQLRETRALLHTLLVRLEERFGEDLDGSGWVGDEPASSP